MGKHQIEFKKNARTFSKYSATQENIKTERRLQNSYKKENFIPEIKPMVENLQDELCQLENKQENGAKLCAKIR